MRRLLRFLRALFGCPHVEMLKERDGVGKLWLVCTSCGHRVPVQLSEPAKVRKLMKQWAKSRRQTSGPKSPATIVVMPKRRKEQA